MEKQDSPPLEKKVKLAQHVTLKLTRPTAPVSDPTSKSSAVLLHQTSKMAALTQLAPAASDKSIDFEGEPPFFAEEPLPRFGSWLDDHIASCFAQNTTSLFYLVRFDAMHHRYITFCAVSPKEVIHNYLHYLLSDGTAPESQTIHTRLREKFSHAAIKQESGTCILNCIIEDCGFAASELSAEQVKVTLFLHHMLYHEKDSEWHHRIRRRIRANFEEALRALREGTE